MIPTSRDFATLSSQMTINKRQWLFSRLKSSGKIFGFLAGLLIGTSGLLAQEMKIVFEHFNIRDGLSDGRVDCILQDSYGFLWFGTQDGLNRYDGYNFTVYDHDIYDSTSISSSWIRCIYEDKSKNLWIGTEGGGLNRYDRATGHFTRWSNEPFIPGGLTNNFVRTILEDSYGILWIGTRSGMVQFDWKKNIFIPFAQPPAIRTARFFPKTLPRLLRIVTAISGLERRIISTVTIDSSRSSNTFLRRRSRRISALFEDSSGNIWIGSRYNGLRKFDRTTHRYTLYRANVDNPTSLGSNESRTFLRTATVTSGSPQSRADSIFLIRHSMDSGITGTISTILPA
jgi:ligand-binding sensor domain-containing protein